MSRNKLTGNPFMMPKLRRAEPKRIEVDGRPMLGCPFCHPTHPIYPDKLSPCGTQLQLTAIQHVYSGKRLLCALCGQPGGTLMKVGEQYIHTHMCTPNKQLVFEQPVLSKSAAWWAKKPVWMQRAVVALTGREPHEVKKLAEVGQQEVIGHTWQPRTAKND